jgi:hypothetical protein
MNRRESLKYLAAGSIASGLLLSGCDWSNPEEVEKSLWKYKYGRTADETAHDNSLLAQQFFTSRTGTDHQISPSYSARKRNRRY